MKIKSKVTKKILFVYMELSEELKGSLYLVLKNWLLKVQLDKVGRGEN